MKKILLAIFLLFLMSSLAIPVLAAEPPPDEAPTIVKTGAEMVKLIESIGNWVFVFLLVITAIMLIAAGFWFVTASGDPGRIDIARKMLIYAVVGLALAIAAKGIVSVVKSILWRAQA